MSWYEKKQKTIAENDMKKKGGLINYEEISKSNIFVILFVF
jgi:hypothetical protein